ncbi:MAG: thioredoxin domain-containing protein [Bacteroidota bacterium]
MKQLAFLITAFISFSSAGQQRLSPKEFRKKLAATPDAILLDVRTPQEVNKGYLNGAVFMDFYDSSFKQQATNIDKEKPVFLYCAIGGRSRDAAKLMQEMGFKNVYDLKGGIIVWKIKNYDYVKLKNDSARQGMNKNEFEKIIAAHPLTFVDFYAPWCAPCKIMTPALERIEKEMKDTAFIVKINADENLQLMKDYGLKALPYILVYKSGKIVFRQEGFMEEGEMKAIIRKFSSN